MRPLRQPLPAPAPAPEKPYAEAPSLLDQIVTDGRVARKAIDVSALQVSRTERAKPAPAPVVRRPVSQPKVEAFRRPAPRPAPEQKVVRTIVEKAAPAAPVPSDELEWEEEIDASVKRVGLVIVNCPICGLPPDRCPCGYGAIHEVEL
jgi:hypothetical protein